MRNSDTAISIKNLSKFYNQLQALDNISFDVKRGDFFAFLGPNGAGKTTTINEKESVSYTPSAGFSSIKTADLGAIRTTFKADSTNSDGGIIPSLPNLGCCVSTSFIGLLLFSLFYKRS